MRRNILPISSLIASVAFATADAAKGGAAAPGKNEPAPPAPEPGAITGQLDSSKAPTIATAPTIAAGKVVLGGRAFAVKQVTRNVFPQRDGQTLFVKIVGAIYQGKKLENASSEQKKMDAAELCEVANLETGELGLIIINAVLKGQLNETYPENGYVGREFAITMKAVEGKRYKAFTLYELEPVSAAE